MVADRTSSRVLVVMEVSRIWELGQKTRSLDQELGAQGKRRETRVGSRDRAVGSRETRGGSRGPRAGRRDGLSPLVTQFLQVDQIHPL